jgi:2-polyprenyl-3-methyl-5-hydroxy-6-metoxy-1,4-benzoquinol methylase
MNFRPRSLGSGRGPLRKLAALAVCNASTVSSSPLYLDMPVVSLVRGDSVLDVGCGLGKWGVLLRANWYDGQMGGPPHVDGIDAFKPMVDVCASSGTYASVWQQELPASIDGQWDTVLASEVIEHIPQGDVDSVLIELERVAKLRVILTTPNWPAFRPGIETSVGYSEHEAHLSYVSRSEFSARGYSTQVYGLGAKPLGRIAARCIRRPGIRHLLSGLPRLVPGLGDEVVAWKDVG